jgi:uncharacterized membrane protein
LYTGFASGEAGFSVSTAKSEAMARSAIQVDWPRVISIALCVIGLLVAGYMTWAEATGNETVCANTGNIDCAAVQQSAYGKTLGIPVAAMGVAGYLTILAVLILEDQIMILATYGRTLVIAMALFGVIFQTYLTYIEGAVLKKWCQWCLTSYAVITLVLVVGIYRLYRFLQPLQRD